jgi:MYXO-CTERM domain-containing protein
MNVRAVVGWWVVAGLTISPMGAVARAESAPGPDVGNCGLGSLAPTPSSGEVPANLPRIWFPVASNLRLVQRGGTAVPAELRMVRAATVLLLTEPLVEGATYDLEQVECPSGTPLATYTVGPAVPAPTALGTLSLEFRAYYPGGRSPRAHFVDVTLARDPSLEPWIDAYDWWLDAEYQRTTLRSTVMRVQVVCPLGASLPYSATGRAGIVPLDELLSTPEVSETFACDDAVVVDYSTGRALTPAEIEEQERLRSGDAAIVDIDAGGSIDGGSATMPTEPDTNGGCSASPAAPRAGWAGVALGMIAAALGLRRRRR